MRLLLTGGAGYVGSACLRWLLKNGHDAVAYDNLYQGNAAAVPPSRLIVGDLSDVGLLTEALRSRRIEAVMHFAAMASVPDSISDPDMYYRVNVVGTKNVLDAMRAADVNRIVISSTAATYSFAAGMPLAEDSPQIPEVPYGTTKLASEWMVKDYAKAYGLGYVIFRYFNASGADLDGRHGECRKSESHLIPLMFAVAVGRRKELLIYGDDYDTADGTCVRDYIHTADLAQAHQQAVQLVRPGEGRVYNLGSGNGASVLEVLRASEQVIGRPIAHRIVGRRSGDPAVLVASSERAKRELGWQPAHSDIDSIVASAWRWHSSHPHGYPASGA
ncbi:MAG TPA: UDP-glucose 4-epimerase GalE [Pirellulales bacterium]|nr:UDP-glucose 4-epimerase GalE [Pirellulales bacterium]